MEGLEELQFNSRVSEAQNYSQVNDSVDQITLHCRRDHLSPTFHEKTSTSVYSSSYSPGKQNFNQPSLDQGLSLFRKHQNSNTLLPTIPKVLEHSQYQNSFQGHSCEKDGKAKEKPSFFLKYNWPLDPNSNYQVFNH